MEEYPSNSHKSREESLSKKPKIEKVISGNVKTKKKSGLHKLSDIFISEDASNVKSYIVMDVLVPAIKKAISDIVTNGIEMMLYGETSKKRGNLSRISYNTIYSDDRRQVRDRRSSINRYEYEDIIFDNKGEAEEVLRCMDEIAETYKLVSVADFYDLVGITGNYTDIKYGWDRDAMRMASTVRVRDGYIIKLPRALPLN